VVTLCGCLLQSGGESPFKGHETSGGSVREKEALSALHWLREVLDPERSVVFLNTDSVPALESRAGDEAAGGGVLSNQIEAELVCQITGNYLYTVNGVISLRAAADDVNSYKTGSCCAAWILLTWASSRPTARKSSSSAASWPRYPLASVVSLRERVSTRACSGDTDQRRDRRRHRDPHRRQVPRPGQGLHHRIFSSLQRGEEGTLADLSPTWRL
jgi:hypothetical protein